MISPPDIRFKKDVGEKVPTCSIVVGDTPAVLVGRLNNFLCNGWVLNGNILFDGEKYMQVITKAIDK